MSEAGEGRPGTSRRRPGPFVPFARFEDIVVRCGHVEKFGLLPEGKDRFRDGRRKKAMGRDCKACRERRQQDELQAAQLRKAQKEQRKAGEAQKAKDKAPGSPQTNRLPAGSRFEVTYDATGQQWSGSLTVPTSGGSLATFTGSASGVFRLLGDLDKQYRATLA